MATNQLSAPETINSGDIKKLSETRWTLPEITALIKKAVSNITLNCFAIGQTLYYVQTSKAYQTEYKTFKEYIATNFEFSTVLAYSMIRITQTFSKEQFTKLGLTKCIELLKLKEEDRTNLIEQATTMTVQELKDTIIDKEKQSPRGRKREKPTYFLMNTTLYKPFKEIKNAMELEQIRKRAIIKIIT